MFEQPRGNFTHSEAGSIGHRLGFVGGAFAKYQPYAWPMDRLVVTNRAG